MAFVYQYLDVNYYLCGVCIYGTLNGGNSGTMKIIYATIVFGNQNTGVLFMKTLNVDKQLSYFQRSQSIHSQSLGKLAKFVFQRLLFLRFKIMNDSRKVTSAEDFEDLQETLKYICFAVGVLAVLFNGVLIVITILDPLSSFQKSSSYLIATLAVSDFVTGVITCFYVFRKHITTNVWFLKICGAFIWTSVQNSVFLIFLMSVQRYVVIKNPLKSRAIVTRRKTMLFIFMVLALSILLGCLTLLPQPYDNYVKLILMVECLLLVICMVGFYIKIIHLLKHASRKFRNSKFSRTSLMKERRKTKEQRNLNIVVLSLVVILCVTVVPHWLIAFYYLGREISTNGTWKKSNFMKIIPSLTFTIELFNFALNPLIYAWRLPEYKQAILYFCRRKQRRSMSHRSYMSDKIITDSEV